MIFELPELDQKKTKEKVLDMLEKYRIYKYLTFEEREASITAGYNERFHGPTNETSDQTAQIALHNVEEQEKRKAFCDKVERAVKRLPPLERFLIEERYMSDNSDYITDHNIYAFKFQPPISANTYTRIRWKAFYKLALNLNIAVTKDS
ncbi:ArpU family phage packaging/lysis transcriptional regulator [Halalkalibacter krulwichiae]|uniref:Phage transcriptional regulator, ArpU family n=1 Tax=Halalkalibacter krulwichiae TaxID=199441 RepID=A0A1X9MFC8_9BACI|nr:ArpU family phage packaging/lysis transcriptional regulator [Halalkalibacter krulwichiae]ARK32149.1 hypothetical protein BkAM31D_21150 [Halalkalibacter krulwichiae]